MPSAAPNAASAQPTRVPAAVPAVASAVSVSFLISEENRIDECVGALRRFDGVAQSLFAPVVHAVGKYHDGFAPLLFFHQIVRRQIHRVIQQRPTSAIAAMRAAPAATTTSAAATIGIAARRASTTCLR